jgi:branched-chain amino acid transport system substrate-binding protein
MSTFDWIGKSLAGRYQIQELVGQGGMSAVYKAYDTNLKRVVAIKMIHTHLSSDPGFVSRFEEEATAIAQLRHPNIVQVHDFNNEDQTYYMVTEFIPGETLQDQLKRLNTIERRMPLNHVIEYMVNICQAADYAHNRGVVHRDIKPANIMLSVHKQAILMDFGIAKIIGGQHYTAPGAVVGTALYMSPEQITGQQLDRRSDIYALGVTLFEMVSGRPPFEADSAMTIMMMHVNDPVPDLQEINPDVPPELVAVINKALAKTPEQRYQTAGEMAAALKDVLVQPAEVPPAAPSAHLAETLVDEPLPSMEQPEVTAATTPESTLPSQEVPPEVKAVGEEAAAPPSPPAEAEKSTRLPIIGNIKPLYLYGGGAVILLGLIAIIIGGLYFSGLFPGGNGESLPAAVISPTKAKTNTPPEADIPATVVPEDTAIPTDISTAAISPISPPPEVTTLKIGEMHPFTGPLSEFGEPEHNAALLAAKHMEEAGYKIETIFGDTETSAIPAVEAARRLVEVEGVHVIIGAAATGVTVPIAESVTIPNQVPQISYASTSPLLTALTADQGADFLFRTCPSDALQGPVLAKMIFDEGVRNVATMYVNNPYGQGLNDIFKLAFEDMGGTVVASVPHDEAAAPSYTAELAQATEGNPEVLIAISYPGHASIYLKEAIEGGFINNFRFVDGTKSEEIADVVGAAALEGMCGTAPGSKETDSLVIFNETYEAEYGEVPPLPFMTTTYDAVIIAALAAYEAQIAGEELTPIAVRDHLRSVAGPPGELVFAGTKGLTRALELLRAGEQIDYVGAAGDVDFDGQGDVLTPIEVWCYEGGVPIIIEVIMP